MRTATRIILTLALGLLVHACAEKKISGDPLEPVDGWTADASPADTSLFIPCGDGVCANGESSGTCPADCASTCGDGVCNGEENQTDCPGDCNSTCGDGLCNGGETTANCGEDCGALCGDGVCAPSEVSAPCPQDCGEDCGDGTCSESENTVDCVADCGSWCGDGACNGMESADLCPADCGATCGDNVCNGPETTVNCVADCGVACGDGACNGTESSLTCVPDCGTICGDGVCNGYETTAICSDDCGSSCGDGQCNGDESTVSCNADCGTSCGDGDCAPSEVNAPCPADCGAKCGDGTCSNDENTTNCVPDCGTQCGDSTCNGSETPEVCPADCGTSCGDQNCDSDENTSNCPGDCGTSCGDGTCNGSEGTTNCVVDCGSLCGDGQCNGNEASNTCPKDCKSSSGAPCNAILSDPLAGSTTGSQNGGNFNGEGWQAPHQIGWDLGKPLTEGTFSVEVTNWNPNSDSTQHQHDKQHIINMYEEPHGSAWDADGDNPKSSYFNIRTGASYDNCYKFLSSTGGFEERLETRAKKPYGTINAGETHTLSVAWKANGTITSYLDGNVEIVHEHGKPFALRYVFIGTDNTIPGTYGPQHDVIYKNLVVNEGDADIDPNCLPDPNPQPANCPNGCDTGYECINGQCVCGPSPTYQEVNGACLTSCGSLINSKGWADGKCCSNGCTNSGVGPNGTWDCNYCCEGADSCASNPVDPPNECTSKADCDPGVDCVNGTCVNECGDNSCKPGVENCKSCPGDCPCGTNTECNDTGQCVEPTTTPETTPPLPDNLSGVVWLHKNVSNWPQTATLSSVTFKGSDICLSYDKTNVWPGVVINVEENTIVNGNPWIFVYQDSTWYAATWEWLRVKQTCKAVKSVAGDHIKKDPLKNFLPVPGETYYFMVSGLARNYAAYKNVDERSNVVKVVWPGGGSTTSPSGPQCGDNQCAPGEENCKSCPGDCPCWQEGTTCNDQGQCVATSKVPPPSMGNEIESGATVILQAQAWNKFCAAEDYSDHIINCNRDTTGSWEEFILEKIDGSGAIQSGDTVALRSVGWDKYCAAEDTDNHIVHCNRDTAGSWEKFTITKINGSGTIHAGEILSIRSAQWNTYCSAESSGEHPFRCIAGNADSWEQFTLSL